MSLKCRICGGEAPESAAVTAKELMYGSRDTFQYFECPVCHCLQITEIPENLGKYYGDGYYSYQVDTPFEDVSNLPKDDRPILDVGCGAGEYLISLYNKGRTNLTGCDPYVPHEIHYPQGIHVYKKTIHEMEGTYDTIYMRDSFEHVTDPHEVFDSLKRLLSPDGMIVIQIPVYPNIAYSEFGTCWYQLDAPRHIHLFSKEALASLARQHGLQVVKREYDSDWGQIVRSFLYQRDIPFFEQTAEMVRTYFSESDIRAMKQLSDKANAGEIGDHARFYLKHAFS